MAEKERHPHSYRCTDKAFEKAEKRSAKEKRKLSLRIEYWVEWWGEGAEIIIQPKAIPAKKIKSP